MFYGGHLGNCHEVISHGPPPTAAYIPPWYSRKRGWSLAWHVDDLSLLIFANTEIWNVKISFPPALFWREFYSAAFVVLIWEPEALFCIGRVFEKERLWWENVSPCARPLRPACTSNRYIHTCMYGPCAQFRISTKILGSLVNGYVKYMCPWRLHP